jgi:hypothetical protein
MSFDEKNAWVFGGIAIAGYVTYLVLLFTAAGGGALDEAPYVAPMVGTILGAIGAGIVGGIVVGMTNPKETKSDRRDKQISWFGERIGNSFVIAGGLAALLLCFVEAPHFWIANVIYLGFVLSAILSTVVRLVAYRRGLREW